VSCGIGGYPPHNTAGAVSSRACLDRGWPLALIQVTVTEVPGWRALTSAVSAPGEVIRWPLTLVMTSPAARPAAAAPVPHSTPATSAPGCEEGAGADTAAAAMVGAQAGGADALPVGVRGFVAPG
jgi:hypothetical protein